MLGVAFTRRHKHKHTQAPRLQLNGELKRQTRERQGAAMLMPPSRGCWRNCTRDGFCQIWYGPRLSPLSFLSSIPPSLSPSLPSSLLFLCRDKRWDSKMRLEPLLLLRSLAENRQSGRTVPFTVCQPVTRVSWNLTCIITVNSHKSPVWSGAVTDKNCQMSFRGHSTLSWLLCC